MYLDPMYTGDYSPNMRQIVDSKTQKQGYNVSRLPYFTEEEKHTIKGTLDYLGLNCYTILLVTPATDPDGMGIVGDPELIFSKNASWESSASEWLKVSF